MDRGDEAERRLPQGQGQKVSNSVLGWGIWT